MKTLNDSRNTQKTSWISLLIVLVFLAFVFYLDQTIKPTNKMYMLLTVLQKGSVYALAAVSMNLLNGYTGLFSLGHAGFMLLGAYTYAIFTIPSEAGTWCISTMTRQCASPSRRSWATPWAVSERCWASLSQ